MKKALFLAVLIFQCAIIWQTAAAAVETEDQGQKNIKAITQVKIDKKMVALTFDDGPNPLYTNQILDTLAKYHAKATFFVIGEHAKEFPEILKREAQEGHEIANHTYTHIYDFDNNVKKLQRELDQSAAVIKSITGQQPALFRPVAGHYSKLVLKTAAKKGYRVVLWSWTQDTRDWSCPGINKITENVISDIKPGDITIFHDSGGDRSQTVCALDSILDYLSKNGYKCVTVSEMLYRSEAKILLPFPISP